MSDVEEVRGKQVIIRFEGKKCIHSRQCVLSRPDVFVPNVDGQWIHPDNATPEEIASLAQSCPSGAITYERIDGGAGEKAPLVNLARIRENGPLALHGEIVIDGETKFRATLCRCGASKNKPYCDGQHAQVGFTASGESATQESSPLTARSGPVRLKVAKQGPVLVEGNLEIVSGTGRVVNRVTKAAFCRCGHSATKPYCDGSHSRIGFKGD